MGFAGYYRTFIPQYSALPNRLNGIKKAEKFLWNEEIQRDFVMLREHSRREGYKLFPTLEYEIRSFKQLTGARRTLQESCPKSRTDRKDSLDVGEESVTSTRGIILVTKVNYIHITRRHMMQNRQLAN